MCVWVVMSMLMVMVHDWLYGEMDVESGRRGEVPPYLVAHSLLLPPLPLFPLSPTLSKKEKEYVRLAEFIKSNNSAPELSLIPLDPFLHFWTQLPKSSRCQREEDKSGRYAFVSSSVEDTMSSSEKYYDLALMIAITTLQSTCNKYGITVVMDQKKRAGKGELEEWLGRRGVEVVVVEPKEYDGQRYHYLKLTAWELTLSHNYPRVALFDSDMVFLRNPDSIFDSCNSYFCGVLEPPKLSLPSSNFFDHCLVARWNVMKFLAYVFGDDCRKMMGMEFNGGLMVLQTHHSVNISALSNHVFHSWRNIKSTYLKHTLPGRNVRTKKIRVKSEQKLLNKEIRNIEILNYEYNAQWIHSYSDVIAYMHLEMQNSKYTWPIALHLKIWRTDIWFFRLIFLAHFFYNPYHTSHNLTASLHTNRYDP